MRSILLPLTDPELDRHSVELALALADRQEGRVTALLALSDFSSLPVYGHYPLTVGWDELVQRTHEHAERREVEVRRTLADLGILASGAAGTQEAAGSKLALRVVSGNPDEAVADCALTHDLILFTRPPKDEMSGLRTSSLLKSTLETAGRPVLVTTGALDPDFGKVVAVAWNGSVEAAHAVTAALPLLRLAERVMVVTFATSRTQARRGADLVDYLDRHGIVADLDLHEPESSVGEDLLDLASAASAGLIVMGGYTHSRLRQTLFGGVTHHMLENSAIPLLMAR